MECGNTSLRKNLPEIFTDVFIINIIIYICIYYGHFNDKKIAAKINIITSGSMPTMIILGGLFMENALTLFTTPDTAPFSARDYLKDCFLTIAGTKRYCRTA